MTRLKVTAFQNGYNGGKEANGTWQKIINEIRPHDVFISGCLGHCAVTRLMKHSDIMYGIDINKHVINSWEEMNWNWINLINGDILEELPKLLEAYLPDRKVCLYVDPTYLMESIRSNVKPYPYTMDEEWHVKFLGLMNQLNGCENLDILVNHYPSQLYLEELEGWRKIDYMTNTRQGMAEEWLFCNFNHTTGELHDYRWLGDNKDERYNLKNRMAKNLIKKLGNMDNRKMQAILYYMRELLN